MVKENAENSDTGNVRVAVSVEGSNESLSVEVPHTQTVSGLRSLLAQKLNRPDVENMALTVEDHDAPARGDTTMVQLFAGARRGRAHIHRCKEVSVTVEYNANSQTRVFPPAATVHRVFVWAISKDALSLETEAHDLELQLPGAASALAPNIHIGTLATNCRLKLELVPTDRPQG